MLAPCDLGLVQCFQVEPHLLPLCFVRCRWSGAYCADCMYSNIREPPLVPQHWYKQNTVLSTNHHQQIDRSKLLHCSYLNLKIWLPEKEIHRPTTKDTLWLHHLVCLPFRHLLVVPVRAGCALRHGTFDVAKPNVIRQRMPMLINSEWPP